ncbi:MAG: serine/threonine protein kinase [Gemmataceae bacterium]|nr:serine/threonine protein kinase [Gemmataceae bacterium]
MSENLSGRQADDGAHGAPRATDADLHLVSEDAIFSDSGTPTDEAPTIISKTPPAQGSTTTAVKAVSSSAEMLLGSLRGRMLAHFELIEPIGVGGMAAVLRARDTQLDRYVALKILPPDMANDQENLGRFRQEARAAAKLDHENIARVFFCGEDQKLHFIAFEFVHGDNLRAILERRGRLPVAEAVRYILQIATGLEHAAARGVVHRDVKPSNIIITPTGRAKLVDMGLARSMEAQRDQLTQSGVTLGTFDYISPEQALEPREADARSDIYSLGCTFYHMLTGTPPVPVGTAAKKVHHHQHVAPIDPRQYNPDVPDEVALVLAKMMAKNPKDRYQRPVQLVQHLLQVAQRVGAAADMPEGVLFVDAPLLSPPRKRPLLLVSLAALALAVLLMVLNLAPPSNRPTSPPRPSAIKDAGAKDSAPIAGPKQVVPANPPAVSRLNSDIASEEDLRALLADTTSPSVKAYVTESFSIAEPGLVFQALAEGKRTLILEGKVPEHDKTDLPVISWKYDPKSDHANLLQLEGAVDATFNNLAFKVEAPPKLSKSPELPTVDFKMPKHPTAAVVVRSSGSIRFVRCTFEQDMPLPGYINVRHLGTPFASVLVQSLPGRTDRPQVNFERCIFKSGQAAIGVQCPADITASQSAFLPHGAVFHLHGDGESRITVKNCSAYVVFGPVIRLDDNASCRLRIDYSVFSCPESTVSDRDPIHLIHQTDGKEPRVAFQKWARNCYHNLNGLWSWPTEEGMHIINTPEEFRTEIAKGGGGGSDNESVVVSESIEIWEHPGAHKRKLDHMRTFRLKDNVPEVRMTDARRIQLGVEKNDLLDVALKPFKDEPRVVGLNLNDYERVVDPAADGSNPRVHRTVAQALNLAESGEVILLKHGKNKRELSVDVTSLKRPGVDVTLRPFDDSYHPILTLADTTDPVAHFFRLHDGKMTFENLEIVLEPDQEKFKAQTLAQLDGNARCEFRNCVITLKQDYEKNPETVPLSVITLSEIDDAMAMMGPKSSRAAAEVVFNHCFIRGEGVAVANPGGRPIDLRLDNTLAGLTGSFLTAKGGMKDAAADPGVKLNLIKSSIFTTRPMFVFETGRNAKGLPPLRVEQAAGCLLVALEDQPLITAAYPDMTLMWRAYVDWRGGGAGNAYVGFDRLLQDIAGDFRLDQTSWQNAFYRDGVMPLFTRATFKLARTARPLWLAVPDDFKTKDQLDMLQPFGAALDETALAPLVK